MRSLILIISILVFSQSMAKEISKDKGTALLNSNIASVITSNNNAYIYGLKDHTLREGCREDSKITKNGESKVFCASDTIMYSYSLYLKGWRGDVRNFNWIKNPSGPACSKEVIDLMERIGIQMLDIYDVNDNGESDIVGSCHSRDWHEVFNKIFKELE